MDNLKTHLKKIHGETDSTKLGKFTCHECKNTFYHAKKLVDHYTNEHKFQIGTKRTLIYCTEIHEMCPCMNALFHIQQSNTRNS